VSIADGDNLMAFYEIYLISSMIYQTDIKK